MKKQLTIIAMLCAAFMSAHAQNINEAAAEAARTLTSAQETSAPAPKPQYWTKTLLTKIDFGQTSFSNWVAGGYNTVTLASYIDGNANYKKDKLSWTNRLQLDYGFIYSEDKPILQGNKDRIYFESKVGYVAAKNLNYTAAFNFKTQFANNYNYTTPSSEMLDSMSPHEAWRKSRKLKAGTFAPAYIDLGFGVDWIPSKWLTVNLAPITGGLVITRIPELRSTYGMELKDAYVDYDGEILPEYYRPMRFELGAQLKTDIKININDKFKYSTQLVLFSDYLDKPLNLRVNWDNMITWQLAKYIALTVTTNLIYDDKVHIMDDDGVARRKLQFKEYVGFGFSYIFPAAK